MSDVKACQHCGKPIERHWRGHRYGAAQWAAKKYCSVACQHAPRRLATHLMKCCPRCGATKPITAFEKSWLNAKRAKWCRNCATPRSQMTYKNTKPKWCRETYMEIYWRNRDKILANRAVQFAIRKGRLVRQPCEVCGCTTVHGHHDDYSKPLEVRWLCPLHHKTAVHR